MKDPTALKDPFSLAFEKYTDMVYRIAMHSTSVSADAEDIAQDVFLKLLSCRKQFESEEHLKAWLIRVTINACHSHFRGRREFPMEQLPEQIAEQPVSVLDEVRALPEKYRNAIYLHYYEGYSVKEIAGILKTRQNTVLSWLRRGRELLRRRMIGGFDDE